MHDIVVGVRGKSSSALIIPHPTAYLQSLVIHRLFESKFENSTCTHSSSVTRAYKDVQPSALLML